MTTMILNDPKAIHRLRPDERSPAAYDLRIPTVSDRVKFRHAVRAEGGKRWTQVQLLAGLADGVRAMLPEPGDEAERDNLLSAIETYRDGITAFASDVRDGTVDDGDPVEFMKVVAERMRPPEIIKGAERAVAEFYPPFAEMIADQEVYHEIAGLVAARMFLVGWEGVDAEFHRGRQAVPDDVLAAIPTPHLVTIGATAEQLMEPTPERLRPLLSRAGTPPDPVPSNGTETPPENAP